jgi:hypothetical protein
VIRNARLHVSDSVLGQTVCPEKVGHGFHELTQQILLGKIRASRVKNSWFRLCNFPGWITFPPARTDSILDEADKRARLELELFLRRAGFEQVEFR